MQPGSITSYLFGTFTPTGGNAPAGLYRFYNASVSFTWENAMGDHFSSLIADTCPRQNDACAFSRDVFKVGGAVPEPATWALMLAGFGLVGSAIRRKRVALAA